MSIQRFTPVLAGDWELDPMTASIIPSDDGEFVTYQDHVAEVEAMRAACIAAVEALKPKLDMQKYEGGYDCCGCDTTEALYVDVLASLGEVQP